MAFRRIIQQILRTGMKSEAPPAADTGLRVTVQEAHEDILRRFGRALVIRHVDAGSCNGCELEIHALNSPYANIEGIGVKFAASPRHADVLLVTGPVTRNLETALKRTYDAMPAPKWVVAMGDCGAGRGEIGEMFCGNYATCGKVGDVIPVDVEVPGCPPDPVVLLQGILAAVSR
jgi:Ni,Fe-hydrogenase III small subunit